MDLFRHLFLIPSLNLPFKHNGFFAVSLSAFFLWWVVYACSRLPLCSAYITFTLLADAYLWIFCFLLISFHFSLAHLFKIKWIFLGLLSTVEMLTLNISGSFLQTVFLVVIFSMRSSTLPMTVSQVGFLLVGSLSSLSRKYNLQIRFGTTAV